MNIAIQTCSIGERSGNRVSLSVRKARRRYKKAPRGIILLKYEAPKPRLPDSIDHPIAVMPPSRMQNTTLAMPLIEDLSRYGIEDCSYSPEAQKKQRLFNKIVHKRFKSLSVQ
ncbi:uncharacterized protein TNCV_2244181 [Trichonephila clavipes]|nr:uncharacterized protein TNCV_2244181 [Trichonephila clavipes]